MKITATRLKELVSYNAETGEFTWASKPNRRIKIGSIAGSFHRGYKRIHLDGIDQQAHRMAWLYTHGSHPTGHIDHINGNRSDNRLINLRDVTPQENMQNMRCASKVSTTGVLGVRKGRGGTWRSEIKVDNKQKYLGEFKTIEAAYEAYVKAKRIYHKGCTI